MVYKIIQRPGAKIKKFSENGCHISLYHYSFFALLINGQRPLVFFSLLYHNII
jgi:hypothetical protein